MAKGRNNQGQQQRQRGGLEEVYGEEDARGARLTPARKNLLTFLIVIPCVMLFFYATGMWDVRIVDGKALTDNLDDIVTAVSLMIGIFTVIIIQVFM